MPAPIPTPKPLDMLAYADLRLLHYEILNNVFYLIHSPMPAPMLAHGKQLWSITLQWGAWTGAKCAHTEPSASQLKLRLHQDNFSPEKWSTKKCEQFPHDAIASFEHCSILPILEMLIESSWCERSFILQSFNQQSRNADLPLGISLAECGER